MGSPVRSPLRGAAAENATSSPGPAPAPAPRDGGSRRPQTLDSGDDAVGSPTRSTLRDSREEAVGSRLRFAEKPITSPAPPRGFSEKPMSPVWRDESAGSPLRSSLRRAERSVASPPRPPRGFSEKPMSPAWREEAVGSPLRAAEKPIPSAPPPPRGFSEKPMSPARRHEAVGSPLRLAEKPFPSPPRNTPEKPGSPEAAAPPLAAAALTIASRLAREDRAMIAKVVAGTIVDGDGGAGAGGGGGGGGGGGSEREGERGGFGGVPGSVRKAEVRRAAVGLRVSAAVLCLISFSTMASDKTQGWAGDSFDRYEEYRYSLAVNVIAFAYSGFQVFAELHRVITGRYIIRRRSSCYLDLTMDQILAYLLISSSSAAASRNDVWVTRFGGDDFTKMVNVSVAMSFLAFFAVALSSVISAYNLFSWNL
ncbi:CASP-like protein 4A2 [Ananas comosus]|uniref:CASP-like protein n=1 Tax=Ananas comosus TaxID=4615 RepID=A0A6P5GAQ0_ANACO|nr:CASP-like protein 4A2 [Ananas comosus]